MARSSAAGAGGIGIDGGGAGRDSGASGGGGTGGGVGNDGGSGGTSGTVRFCGPPMGFNPYNAFWTNANDIASKVLLNAEVIAIDQDSKSTWATRVKNTGGVQIYKKALATAGTYAVALVNMNGSVGNITLNFSDIGLTTVTAMRDL